MTYCGPWFWGVVGDDPVKLEWHRSSEHCLLDFWPPHQASNLICRSRGRAPSGVLRDGVLLCQRGQVVVPLGKWAAFEVFPCFSLLEMAGAYGVFRRYVYTSPGIPACHPV